LKFLIQSCFFFLILVKSEQEVFPKDETGSCFIWLEYFDRFKFELNLVFDINWWFLINAAYDALWNLLFEMVIILFAWFFYRLFVRRISGYFGIIYDGKRIFLTDLVVWCLLFERQRALSGLALDLRNLRVGWVWIRSGFFFVMLYVLLWRFGSSLLPVWILSLESLFCWHFLLSSWSLLSSLENIRKFLKTKC
jgi:hypothetical protein